MNREGPPAQEGESTPEPSRLGGRYELGAVLGYGGMAVVRLGTDLRLGRTVAVKMLRGELTEAPAFQARFRREARAAAGLNHPAIVSVYDAGEETVDGVLASYIVMEYVEGQTLRDLLRSGPRDPDHALEITADVLDALEESHRSGIVHRDVKPANVMVTPSGAVKVMDFGVARALADMSAALTQTSTVIGTAYYLSPEQARGDSVDARSDVYSTGCLLYELLTGRPPFQGDSAIAVAYQHVREDPQPPSAFQPGLSPEIDAIVMGALAKQPGERYQSAAEMRRAILGVLAGEQAVMPMTPVETTAELQAVAGAAEPTTAVHSSVTGADAADETARGRRRRRNAGFLIAAAAMLLVLALGGFALSGLGDAPRRTQDGEQVPGRGGVPGQTPTSQSPSGSVAPAATPNSDPNRPVQEERSRREGAQAPRSDKRPVGENAGRTAGQDAGIRQPEPTQNSEPPSASASASAPEETATEETTAEESTASESQPAESTAPEETAPEEPASPTTPPPGQNEGP